MSEILWEDIKDGNAYFCNLRQDIIYIVTKKRCVNVGWGWASIITFGRRRGTAILHENATVLCGHLRNAELTSEQEKEVLMLKLEVL